MLTRFRIFSLLSGRFYVLLWLLLGILASPSGSYGQQATAIIREMSGTVLISETTPATIGMTLQPGDSIQTSVGARVVVELFDGSILEIGENTNTNFASLPQEAIGARISRMKLLWGRVRALLSQKYQQKGATFDIETPNAVVGVKFSHPDIEVFYDPNTQETVGLAHTVQLLVTHLSSGETQLIPIGSTVVITAAGIKVIAGIIAVSGATASAGTTAPASAGTGGIGTAGLSTGTLVALGVGSAATIGAITTIAFNADKQDAVDLSGFWAFTEYCINGNCQSVGDDPDDFYVTQTENVLSSSGDGENGAMWTLNGRVSGVSVSFIMVFTYPNGGQTIQTFSGIIAGRTIHGNFSGTSVDGLESYGTFTIMITPQ